MIHAYWLQAPYENNATQHETGWYVSLSLLSTASLERAYLRCCLTDCNIVKNNNNRIKRGLTFVDVLRFKLRVSRFKSRVNAACRSLGNPELSKYSIWNLSDSFKLTCGCRFIGNLLLISCSSCTIMPPASKRYIVAGPRDLPPPSKKPGIYSTMQVITLHCVLLHSDCLSL